MKAKSLGLRGSKEDKRNNEIHPLKLHGPVKQIDCSKISTHTKTKVLKSIKP